MKNRLSHPREVRAYIFLASLVICGLAGSLITASKITHIGIDFPFSNIVFSILTYPIVDCICELWGKEAALQTLWLGLMSQIVITIIIQLSIMMPHAAFWRQQAEYQMILSTSTIIVIASLLAFAISQLLDIVVYQRLKELSHGKRLWLRSNISTYLGQAVDSIIFVSIVFYSSSQKYDILLGSICVKIALSLLMTPIVYLVIIITNNYLNSNTLAFKDETTQLLFD